MIKGRHKWSSRTINLSKELHSELSLNEENWHKYKSDADRRAAELLASALIQLLQDGSLNDVKELTEQSLLWIKREIKDPGCPRH